MELQEAIKEIKLWNEAYKEVIFLDFYDKRYLRAIDTVLKELERLQKENEEKDSIIKDVQDELRHIPSAVSEMM